MFRIIKELFLIIFKASSSKHRVVKKDSENSETIIIDIDDGFEE